jgi:hypothetical protein
MMREVLPGDCTSIDDRIDEQCDDFESAWRNGERPSIVEIIQQVDEPHRKRLFCELLLVELECRRTLGEQPTEGQYLRDFPEFAAQVHEVKFQYGATAFLAAHVNGGNPAQAIPRQRGSQVAHFELIERLGAGAMGEAWKAWDSRLRRNVTIKLPHNHSLTANDFRRFLREGEAAAQLSHPQLSSVHEINNDDHTFYIVANFIEGNNLREYAAKKKLRIQDIVDLCAGIGEVLQFAHDKGVVHRDLKPANIIVDPNGIPHIIDFGLAKIADADHELTMNGELLGTPAYMSPELANGDGATADARTDIYSLGAILYELLTERKLFDGNRGSVISQILACAPAPPRSLRASVPRDTETICLKAIEKVPENRYATARDMAEDLRRYASGRAIRARRVGVVEKSWRLVYRHPFLAAFAVLFVAAIMVSSTTIASLQHRNRRLAGFRPVRITTTPPGARVALVPLDPNTNEPVLDPAGIIRPTETTPLTTEARVGTYLVEAVIRGSGKSEFVEVYRTVIDSSRIPAMDMRANVKAGLDADTCRFWDINVDRHTTSMGNMAQILIPEDLCKQNPLLPGKLYVDIKQTSPEELKARVEFARLLRVTNEGDLCVSYQSALKWAEKNQSRLPSAAEYDAIVSAVEHGEARLVDTGLPVRISDLFDNLPELTTTTKTASRLDGNAVVKHFNQMHVLKGFAQSPPDLNAWMEGVLLVDQNIDSPHIRIRGVRSATPRFVKP